MRREILIAYRDRLGKSQRVVNALDKSDTDSDTLNASTDARVRVASTLDDVAAQTIILTPTAGDEDFQVRRDTGFIDVRCFAVTMLDVLRLRDACHKETTSCVNGFITISSSAGIVAYQGWAGDGSVRWIDELQLYEADGSAEFISFNES